MEATYQYRLAGILSGATEEALLVEAAATKRNHKPSQQQKDLSPICIMTASRTIRRSESQHPKQLYPRDEQPRDRKSRTSASFPCDLGYVGAVLWAPERLRPCVGGFIFVFMRLWTPLPGCVRGCRKIDWMPLVTELQLYNQGRFRHA